MPAFLLPQLLLCGLVVARDRMATGLHWLSAVLPMTYAYDALARAQTTRGVSSVALRDLGVTIAFTLVSLALGAATLRRRTS